MTDCSQQNGDNKITTNKLPSWIEPKIFEGVLENINSNFQEIIDFKAESALAPGENYASVMLKVEIIMKLKDNTQKPISFMLKTGHDSELFDEFMKNHDVFMIEAGMYRDFVPEFEQIFKDNGVHLRFGAQSYQLPVEHNYILLENLKVQGFKNANRLEGLDMAHTKCVLKKMAQWHAASAVRVAEKGPYPRDYCTAYMKRQAYDWLKSMFDGSTKILLECIKDYSNSELYYDKVEKLQHQITDEMFKCTDEDTHEFNVLNHGDCWSNNIMFKYDDEGNILETYFIDLQMPRYAPPAEDLWYFLLSSTKLEIKIKEFDFFIKYYHDNLVESLQLLRYTKHIPSLKELHHMLNKCSVFAFMTATNVMAAVLCDPTDNATMDNFVNDSEDGINFKRQMFSNDRYRKHMEALLPWLLNKGFLDC